MRTVPARGFTLLELLIVVAIIGILSTVVLASLKDARLKAADATVRQEAIQLRNLMEQERTDSGTYTALKNGGDGSGSGGWIPAGGACDVSLPNFSGQFAGQAAAVCAKLVAATGSYCGSNCVYFKDVNIAAMPSNPTDRYTIEAYLPYTSQQAGEARWLCLGSSGGQSIADGALNGGWIEDGCLNNP